MTKSIINNWDLMILMIGLLVTSYGLYAVYIVGFHGFDMAQNMIFIRDNLRIDLLKEGVDWNPIFFETDTKGNTMSLEDAYKRSVVNLLNGIPIAILGAGMIGYAVGRLTR